MPQSDHPEIESDADPSAPTVQLRIDPPHVIAAGPEDVDAVQAEAVDSVAIRESISVSQSVAIDATSAAGTFSSSLEAEQLHLQAEQLASHLRAQQEQIDRREADLHAQLAQHENGARGARLWFRERQQELTDREADIVRREREIELREEALTRADRQQAEVCERIKSDQRRQNEAFDGRRRELDERQQALDRQEGENAAVSSALERCAREQENIDERLREETAPFNRQVTAAIDMIGRFLRGEEFSPVNQDHSTSSHDEITVSDAAALFDELAAGLKRLRVRQGNLEEAEALLVDGQTALDDACRKLDADRRVWQDRCEAEGQEAARTQARVELDLEKKLQALKGRADHLERRSAAVDQLRAEVLRTQRESLELRLATDELWAQMMGTAPPAALSQSLAQIRGKLAEQYRLERAELAGQQTDLETLAGRLDHERERVQQQKQELERWAANRQADIEGQAARLAAREQHLDRRQAELDQLQLAQQIDRRAYEREIRRLLGQLRHEDADAVPAHAA